MIQKKIISFIGLSDVYEMHDLVIQELGGKAGIHDENLLESAINQPFMTFI